MLNPVATAAVALVAVALVAVVDVPVATVVVSSDLSSLFLLLLGGFAVAVCCVGRSWFRVLPVPLFRELGIDGLVALVADAELRELSDRVARETGVLWTLREDCNIKT